MRIVKRTLVVVALVVVGYVGLEVATYRSDSTYLGFIMQMYSGWKTIDTVEQGDMAPDFALVPLRDYDFGIDALYDRYRDQVEFLLVYLKEAHPADGWSIQVNPKLRYVKDPVTETERFQVANSCMLDLAITIPCVIDSMDNSTMQAYNAFPDRLYLIGKNGRIVFKGGPGPWGFKPDQLEAAIEAELQRMNGVAS